MALLLRLAFGPDDEKLMTYFIELAKTWREEDQKNGLDVTGTVWATISSALPVEQEIPNVQVAVEPTSCEYLPLVPVQDQPLPRSRHSQHGYNMTSLDLEDCVSRALCSYSIF